MAQWPDTLSHPGLFLREEEIRTGIEFLYFAYRDLSESTDSLLEAEGFGRAHHRVLYFISRHPGMPVKGLLKLLNITKQSLSRVLKHCVDKGYVTVENGTQDRRQRHLYLTDKGRDFERLLFTRQKEKMAKAYRRAGVESVNGFKNLLLNIMHEDSQNLVMNKKD